MEEFLKLFKEALQEGLIRIDVNVGGEYGSSWTETLIYVDDELVYEYQGSYSPCEKYRG